MRDWLVKTGAKRIVITADLFHTRRVAWLYAKELKDMGVEAIISPVTPREFTATDWWHHEEGLIAFQTEVIKYACYRLKY